MQPVTPSSRGKCKIKNIKTKKSMKKRIKIITFYIGIDILGFPKYCEHYLTEKFAVNSTYFKAYSRKY